VHAPLFAIEVEAEADAESQTVETPAAGQNSQDAAQAPAQTSASGKRRKYFILSGYR